MGFFDKLKEGASKAADKAKESVEVVRLNSQISAKRKDIEKNYIQIGEAVFQANLSNDLTAAEPAITKSSEQIVALQQEIDELEEKIMEIKDEKDCVCGKVVPIDTKFCPSCGHKFEEVPAAESTEEPEVVPAPTPTSSSSSETPQ
ncbi:MULTISPECIES: zinc ribbon domain-containing protein [Bacillota]|uniref:zinc ribbon domain-containing protein n=1 Tax=Bacillota TaxID=1239 RepID=UPI0004B3B055|nr:MULTISPECIES: zinc ribbon domain-containing protein [Bacillota]